jgi:hypothetical protein
MHVAQRLRFFQRYLSGAARDFVELLTGRRDPGLPPHRYRRVGKGDFREMGDWVASSGMAWHRMTACSTSDAASAGLPSR